MSIEMMADSLLHSPIVPTSFMKDLLVYHLAVTCVHHVQTETQQNLTNNTNMCAATFAHQFLTCSAQSIHMYMNLTTCAV